jgi:hypothetical protein
MARIVTSAYRYKRPPRRKKAVALDVPAIVRAAEPAKARKRATTVRQSDEVIADRPPANDDRKLVETSARRASKSAIVTAHKPGKQHAFVPDLAEEEVQRRRDTADAMMRDFKRQIAENDT